MDLRDPARVRPLTEALVGDLARLLANAFEVDPAFRYLFPDPARRRAGLEDFFARNLRVHLPYRCTFVAVDAEGKLIATVTLRPPGGVPVSMLTMLRRGLLPFGLAHGFGAVKRLLWLKQTYDALEAALAERGRHYYVHMMAVQPEHQGTGIGSFLLREVLARETAAAPELPIVLTTHQPRNVVFYRKQGFDLLGEQPLAPPGGAPYPVWSMRRGPS